MIYIRPEKWPFQQKNLISAPWAIFSTGPHYEAIFQGFYVSDSDKLFAQNNLCWVWFTQEARISAK